GPGDVNYPAMRRYRQDRLRRAFAQFRPDDQYQAFCNSKNWLDDFALFQAMKTRSAASWVDWDPPLRRREAAALASAKAQLQEEMDFQRFVQFQFDRQWRAFREAALQAGIKLI